MGGMRDSDWGRTGPRSLEHFSDLTVPSHQSIRLSSLVDLSVRTFGRVDVLFNNAAD
jgi:NAD(P)-dependent dehydrogenase (short-subunit alcohol dehydrogenase family)